MQLRGTGVRRCPKLTATNAEGVRAGVVDEPVSVPPAPEADGRRVGAATDPWWRQFSHHRVGRYWKPVAMLAATRAATFFVLYLSHFIPSKQGSASTFTVVGGMAGGHRFDRLAAWDGGWYIAAAQHGWPHTVPMSGGAPAYSTLAFFPGFPLSIRAVHFLGLGWLFAGFVTALLFQIAMVVLVWQLFKEIWGESVADRGLLLFLVFPGAIAFSLIYSEPMLFAAAAACFLALRRRWWTVAGLSAAVGTAVRPVGAALIACCAWEAFRAVRTRRDWSSLVAPLLSPLGIVGWMGYLWVHTGSPFIWSKAEKAWDDSFDPLTLIKRFISHQTTNSGRPLPHYLPLAGVLFCVIALVFLYKAKGPSVLVIYSLAVTAIAASSKVVNLRPRLVETAFPLVIVFGYWLKDSAYTLVVTCSAVALGGFLFVTLVSPKFIP